MKVLVAGATGMIGRCLVDRLSLSHEVSVLGRSISKLNKVFPGKTPYSWESLSMIDINRQDVVINLAGDNIGDSRWTQSKKDTIIRSRVDATKAIVDMCLGCGDAAPRILNASAIGVYPSSTSVDDKVDERSIVVSEQENFLSRVASAWENTLKPAESMGLSVAKLRFAVVLNKDSGALAKMLLSYRLGLGAVLGEGQQAFSWVSLEDAVRAIVYLADNPQLTGPFNIVADEVVSQEYFANSLAAYLNRPRFMTLPSFVVKMLFAQMGEELLLSGASVKASRLIESGFCFKHKTLQDFFQSEL